MVGAVEAVDGERLDRRSGAAVANEIGHDLADAGRDLKTRARKPERMDEPGVVMLGPMTGLRSGVSASVPVQKRIAWA